MLKGNSTNRRVNIDGFLWISLASAVPLGNILLVRHYKNAQEDVYTSREIKLEKVTN